MNREYELFLNDIIVCIDRIFDYVEDMSFDEFSNSQIHIDAVIRNFEIIGEATIGIPQFIKDKYSEIPWRVMKDLRNRVMHVYFGVDLEIIWNIIHNKLPSLREMIEAVIENET